MSTSSEHLSFQQCFPSLPPWGIHPSFDNFSIVYRFRDYLNYFIFMRGFRGFDCKRSVHVIYHIMSVHIIYHNMSVHSIYHIIIIINKLFLCIALVLCVTEEDTRPVLESLQGAGMTTGRHAIFLIKISTNLPLDVHGRLPGGFIVPSLQNASAALTEALEAVFVLRAGALQVHGAAVEEKVRQNDSCNSARQIKLKNDETLFFND